MVADLKRRRVHGWLTWSLAWYLQQTNKSVSRIGLRHITEDERLDTGDACTRYDTKCGPSGQKRAQRVPKRAQERFGRKMGPEGPSQRVCVKEGRFSDGTFPIGKVTFLVFARTCVKILNCFWKMMKKINGKPYLRTRIALRVVVWWPFCDFFFKNLIPTLVKVSIGPCGAWKRYKRFFNRCHFFQGKSIGFEMRAAMKKNGVEEGF